MKLIEIIKDYKCEYDFDIDITDVTCDSRNVKEGSMFFCIKGYKTDGHDYALMAKEKGASVIVVTRYLDIDIPQVLVDDDREAMAVFSNNFFGNPSDKLTMVGITGTNGKTTTTYLCSEIAKKAGKKVGIIGTICNIIGDKEYPTNNTTPESVELFRLLALMVKEKVDVVFMEVSSHSLYLKRVASIQFTVGAFTNLSQDHLDFHNTMENYIEAKSILFKHSNISVINYDDEWYDYLKRNSKNTVIPYSINNNTLLCAKDIQSYSWGNKFIAVYNDEEFNVTLHIPGLFSVYNALCSIGIAKSLGYSNQSIMDALEKTKGVSGRCEVLKSEPYTIILDYAHTPDGLENILRTFKGFGRIVCVFGCGGNRDTTKRKIMGEIAGKYSDFVIITSDNPRFEEPMSIILEIEKGVVQTDCDYKIIEDRRQAIKYAIDNAHDNDIVILAGKGHETYQEIKGIKHNFDEKDIVDKLLK